ncbi:transposase of IS200 family [Streptococcus suis TL13]|nr:transposase of IS200 family [Streptococcus suis TL13]
MFKPIVKRKEKNMAQKAHSLSHTKWLCKYHIVFTPKYRRKIIYNQYRSSLGEIFRRLCTYKGVGNYRRTSDAGSCSYVSQYSSAIKCIKLYGIFKR